MRRNKIGYHLPKEVSILESAPAAKYLNLDAFQVYLAARLESWWPIKVSEELGAAVTEAKQGLWAAAHAPFVVNILTDPGGYRYANHSWKSLVYHLQRAELLGFDAVVFHMGSPGEQGAEKGLKNAYWYLTNVFDMYSGPVKLCIENDANPKKDPAGHLPTITEIIDTVGNPNLRLCFDTTHAFAYGHDITQPEILNEILEQIKPYVEMVHFNQPLPQVFRGSFKDRHSDVIDQGAFGVAPLKQVWDFFEGVPLIIEGTPDIKYDVSVVDSW